jgi:hypothetical protein
VRRRGSQIFKTVKEKVKRPASSTRKDEDKKSITQKSQPTDDGKGEKYDRKDSIQEAEVISSDFGNFYLTS